MIYENKIINLDFLLNGLSISNFRYTDAFSIQVGTFTNCIFIGNSEVEYYFKYSHLNDCTFYSPHAIHIDETCTVSNIAIIDNSDQKRFMHISIKKLCSNIILDSCNFWNCNIKEFKGNVKFINCVNEPRFYKNKKPFYGYKHSKEGYLIILEIPEGAMVYESNNKFRNKCRTDKAKVVSILNMDGTYSGIKECNSWYDNSFIYKVGEDIKEHLSILYNECAQGIHFFKHPKEAYQFYKFNNGIMFI